MARQNIYYKVGGYLEHDNPSYIERSADRELYEELIAGKFCYVFNSRQMGKTSLQVRVIKKLENEGYRCVSIDPGGIGTTGVTRQEWYRSIIEELANAFHLQPEHLSQFWQENKDLTPLLQLNYFFEKLLLQEIEENIVIFIDEIDNVLSLKFPADDFFIFIRYCYNQRASKPDYKRLTFALLGVATPSKLIQNTERTPFNIGYAIQLTPFSLKEAKHLAQGLERKINNAEIAEYTVQEIFRWTGGQPFLTQKLCQMVVESEEEIPVNKNEVSKWIDTIVYANVIINWEEQDNPQHFSTIRNRIINSKEPLVKILKPYLKILQYENVKTDGSIEQSELILSGLVLEKNGNLEIYNLLYQNIFDSKWVAEMLADTKPYEENLQGWLSSNQDKTWLLHGQILRKAMQWSADKILTIEDYQFLNASQESEIVNKELEIKKSKRFQKLIAGIAVIASIASVAIALQLKEKIQCMYPYVCERSLFSQGDNSFFLGNGNYYLRQGVETFKRGLELNKNLNQKELYEKAIYLFEKAKKTDRTDPEAEIYYNNALAQKKGNYLTLAVAVPINEINARRDLARETLRGVAQAQSEFNQQQESNDPLLNIVIADDHGDPEYAKKVAKELIKDKRVLGVIGHSASSISYAVVGEYSNAGLVMISPSSSSTKLSWEELKKDDKVVYKNKVFYRATSSDIKIGETMAQYVIKKHIKKIVVFHKEGDTSSESIKTQFKKFFENKQAGRRVVLVKDLASIYLDASNEADHIFDQQADGVVFLPSLDLVSTIIEILREIKKDKRKLPPNFKIITATGLYSADFIKQGKDALEGLVLATTWFAGDPDPNVKTFADKVCSRWEEGITSRTAAAYDATKALIKAMSDSKNPPTRETVLAQLKDVRLSATETSGYPLQFQNGELHNPQNFLIQIVKNRSDTKNNTDPKYPCKSFEESGFHLELVK